MNQRALALVESLRSQLTDPMRSVSADASLSWLFVRISAATDEILRRVAREPMSIDLPAGAPLFKAGAKVSAAIDTACISTCGLCRGSSLAPSTSRPTATRSASSW